MNAPRRRRVTLAAVGGLYVIACAVTIDVGRHPLRPLYEGIGPAAPYRWVNPPAQFRATNSFPSPVSESVNLTATGSPQVGATSGDGQVVLSLPAGAIPPRRSENVALVSISPFDPAKLGALPVALYSDGNAYRVAASYQPSAATIPAAAKPVDVVIETPVPSSALLESSDGRTWTRLVDHHIPGQAAVAATFTNFGYLLAAANVPVVVKPASGGSRVLLVVILGLVALLPIAAALIWRNGRRRSAR